MATTTTATSCIYQAVFINYDREARRQSRCFIGKNVQNVLASRRLSQVNDSNLSNSLFPTRCCKLLTLQLLVVCCMHLIDRRHHHHHQQHHQHQQHQQHRDHDLGSRQLATSCDGSKCLAINALRLCCMCIKLAAKASPY